MDFSSGACALVVGVAGMLFSFIMVPPLLPCSRDTVRITTKQQLSECSRKTEDGSSALGPATAEMPDCWARSTNSTR
jgi:hypothetical protein